MADFMTNLKNEYDSEKNAVLQETENGALGYSTSGKYLLDLSFKTASYRTKSDAELLHDFDLAFNEDNELAVKFAFLLRDIREGIGERDSFRKIFRHLITTSKSPHIPALLKLLSEYGRWDDLFYVAWGTPYEDTVVTIVGEQLTKDTVALANGGKGVSLLGKWIPRENCSDSTRIQWAKELATKLGLSPRQYRKKVVALNRYLDTIEIKVSAGEWNKVNYEHVPSQANLKYKNAFLKHDEERRRAYLEALSKGEAKMNMSVGFPHDIVHAYVKDTEYSWMRREIILDEALEGAWKNLKNFEIGNTIVVSDSSGSMTCPVGNTTVQAIEVAHGLGIYCGDHCTGPFHNKLITFSENPTYIEWKDSDTLANKLNLVFGHSEIANTNIEKVFQLILNTAVNNHCKQEDLPGTILLISDMEMDAGSARNGKTYFQEIEDLYKAQGYTVPRTVWWNVNSHTSTVPVQQAKNGTALVSGFSVNVLKMVLSNHLDPFEVLKEQLMADRYKNVVW
jgi:hypothetical protein